MATRMKTVEFAMPALATAADNALTSLTQITIYLPESSKTFKSVVTTMTAGMSLGATTVSTVLVESRLAAVAYTGDSTLTGVTNTGEDIFVQSHHDLTSHFTTNWSGTSMTFDTRVQLDAGAASWRNICVTIYVTYEYDDTSATQIKTIRIPMLTDSENHVGSISPSKNTTFPQGTIPLLDTELPEASKVYRNSFMTFQANSSTNTNPAVSDFALTFQLDSTTAHTTTVFERDADTDYWMRYIWDCSSVLNTAASMTYYYWGADTGFNHPQSWLTVTYEFDATASNDVFVSIMVPFSAETIPNLTSTNRLRIFTDFYIEEPGTITTKQISVCAFWSQAGTMLDLFSVSIGETAMFQGYDEASVLAGTNGMMVTDNGAFTFTRGKNTVYWNVFSTDSGDVLHGLTGFWFLNYTAEKPTQGYGAANKTVFWSMGKNLKGSAVSGAGYFSTSTAGSGAFTFTMPGSDFYINNLSMEITEVVGNNTTGWCFDAERTTAEGNFTWLNMHTTMLGLPDAEVGTRISYADCTPKFQQYVGDVRNSNLPASPLKLDFEEPRRWRFTAINGSYSAKLELRLVLTYHEITFEAAGDITDSDGGTINLSLHNAETNDVLALTSRVGDGAYSFTWYDDTENVYVSAFEDNSHLGRSIPGPAV